MLWTSEQSAIFDNANSKNSMFIRALAGTGKSTTLQQLAQQMRPRSSGLALAFNVKIAEELKARLPFWFEVRTLNGLAMSAWCRTVRKKVEVNPNLIADLLRPYALPEEEWLEVRQLISSARHKGLVPEGCPGLSLLPDVEESWQDLADYTLRDHYIKIAREVIKQTISRAYNGEIDFDGQIYCATLFGGDFKRYPVVLGDEVQDFATLNLRMVRRVAEDRLIVAGDEFQSLYAFRGADPDAMDKLHELRSLWDEHTLSVTFRCPRAVVRRRNHYIPQFTAAPGNPEGVILDFRNNSWYWHQIPKEGTVAILSRNNAPLISMGYALARCGVAFQSSGGDIASSTLPLAKKLLPLNGTVKSYLDLVEFWRQEEIKKLVEAEKFSRADRINDQAEALILIINNTQATSIADIKRGLEAIKKPLDARVTISTVHKAKGLEYDHVLSLDPWRIPSIFARNEPALRQESNILNVLETRTRVSLILADLKDFSGE